MKRRMGMLRHHPYSRPESDSICLFIAPSCSSTSIIPQKPTAPRAYSHEEIGSFCTTSPTFGAEYETWEAEWAESEVGEGLEEIWERAVSLDTSREIGLFGG
jgi:hypothetical protein